MAESAPPSTGVLAEHHHGSFELKSDLHGASPGMVEIRVDKASEVDHVLNDAISQVMEAATKYRLGIMVTRLDAGWYIVRAHPEVPFGLTRQQYP